MYGNEFILESGLEHEQISRSRVGNGCRIRGNPFSQLGGFDYKLNGASEI